MTRPGFSGAARGGAALAAALLAALQGVPAPAADRGAAPLRAAETPRIESVDAAGLQRVLEAERGKVVVLNFWATWCEPCREEFPDLVRLARENPATVSLVTVSLDDPAGSVEGVSAFLRELGAPGRALIKAEGDPDPFIRSVDPAWSGVLPATFVNAQDGRRVRAIHGPTTYAALKDLLSPLLKPAT